MERTFVTEKLAKLLKEKKFNWGCIAYYCERGHGNYTLNEEIPPGGTRNTPKEEDKTPAPIYEQVWKWLELEKRISIKIKPTYYCPESWRFEFKFFKNKETFEYVLINSEIGINKYGWKTRWEAFEAAVKLALEELTDETWEYFKSIGHWSLR